MSHMVQGPTFLSLTAWRQVSEAQLTKAVTGPRSRGTSFGAMLRHHVQRYCSIGILYAHGAVSLELRFLPAFYETIAAQCELNAKWRLLVPVTSTSACTNSLKPGIGITQFTAPPVLPNSSFPFFLFYKIKFIVLIENESRLSYRHPKYPKS